MVKLQKNLPITLFRSSKEINGHSQDEDGFSIVELIMAMAISLIILYAAVLTFSSAISSRTRESSKTDAITSAQAALNIMSREIGNSGYGLKNDNGLVTADCTNKRLHFRTNLQNNNSIVTDQNENVTFFWDSGSQSVVKYDAYSGGSTSGIVNQISDVTFTYYNYATNGTATAGSASADTGRVTVTLTINLLDVQGQPSGQTVTLKSDITLRNSPYMLGQY
jgi:prepilin-type N-terminal cleavage/methylation domain-containing protein